MWSGTEADTQSAEGSSGFSDQPAPAFRFAALKVLRPIRGTSDRTTLRKRCTHAAWTGRSTQFSSSFSASFPRVDVPRERNQRKFRARTFKDEFSVWSVHRRNKKITSISDPAADLQRIY